jgi:hypothetical protein
LLVGKEVVTTGLHSQDQLLLRLLVGKEALLKALRVVFVAAGLHGQDQLLLRLLVGKEALLKAVWVVVVAAGLHGHDQLLLHLLVCKEALLKAVRVFLVLDRRVGVLRQTELNVELQCRAYKPKAILGLPEQTGRMESMLIKLHKQEQ